MRDIRTQALAAISAACVLALAGCGGGGSSTTPNTSIASVKVMGDSLADSGTFGYKFTVQGTGIQIYPERVAASYGLSLCNHYTATSASTFVTNLTPGCTNYAVGDGRINYYNAPTSPFSIPQQLKDAAAAGTYASTDLVLIDGGGNDAADLVSFYLAASTDGGASYLALLGTLLPAATIQAGAAQGATGLAGLGVAYMTALADSFAATITATTTGNGASHVAVLNLPAINKTPRFQAVLNEIAAATSATGGATAGATARAQAEALFVTWISAYNTELAAKFSGNSKVVVVDFYSSFLDEVTNPSNYNLQNVTTPVCPQTGTDSSNLPTYDFPTCTATLLSSETPPAGSTGGANWWQSYGFSDSFHPTPYTHDLLARYISRSLSQAGWL